MIIVCTLMCLSIKFVSISGYVHVSLCLCKNTQQRLKEC